MIIKKLLNFHLQTNGLLKHMIRMSLKWRFKKELYIEKARQKRIQKEI